MSTRTRRASSSQRTGTDTNRNIFLSAKDLTRWKNISHAQIKSASVQWCCNIRAQIQHLYKQQHQLRSSNSHHLSLLLLLHLSSHPPAFRLKVWRRVDNQDLHPSSAERRMSKMDVTMQDPLLLLMCLWISPSFKYLSSPSSLLLDASHLSSSLLAHVTNHFNWILTYLFFYFIWHWHRLNQRKLIGFFSDAEQPQCCYQSKATMSDTCWYPDPSDLL